LLWNGLDAAVARLAPTPLTIDHTDEMQIRTGSLYPKARQLEVHGDDCSNDRRLSDTILL
jgi:hypothetical protein